jgi:hypothetical protein
MFAKTIEEYMIKIDPMTDKKLIEVQKFIKIARHSWHPEFHRALSNRLEDLRTCG